MLAARRQPASPLRQQGIVRASPEARSRSPSWGIAVDGEALDRAQLAAVELKWEERQRKAQGLGAGDDRLHPGPAVPEYGNTDHPMAKMAEGARSGSASSSFAWFGLQAARRVPHPLRGYVPTRDVADRRSSTPPGGFRMPRPEPGAAVIEVEGLQKLYGDFPAVQGLSFKVQPGRGPGPGGTQRRGQDHHHPEHRRNHHPHCAEPSASPATTWPRPGGRQVRCSPSSRTSPICSSTSRSRSTCASSAGSTGSATSQPGSRGCWRSSTWRTSGTALPGELSRGMKQKLAIACGSAPPARRRCCWTSRSPAWIRWASGG